jgi:hypothetical protein
LAAGICLPRLRRRTRSVIGEPHYCSKTRNGKFVVKRKTQAKRLVRKLKAIRLRSSSSTPLRIWLGVAAGFGYARIVRTQVSLRKDTSLAGALSAKPCGNSSRDHRDSPCPLLVLVA